MNPRAKYLRFPWDPLLSTALGSYPLSSSWILSPAQGLDIPELCSISAPASPLEFDNVSFRCAVLNTPTPPPPEKIADFRQNRRWGPPRNSLFFFILPGREREREGGRGGWRGGPGNWGGPPYPPPPPPRLQGLTI